MPGAYQALYRVSSRAGSMLPIPFAVSMSPRKRSSAALNRSPSRPRTQPPVPTPVPQQQPYAPQQFGQPPRPPVQTQECQTTATIRNQVNLKKQTLTLEATAQQGIFNITFSFDASAPCRVTTFVCAHEDVRKACKITGPFPGAPAVSYPKGVSSAPRSGHW